MERLTERDNGMTFLVCREGCNGGPACIECEQKAINRLAAYEDTMSIERALELAQAEKDGRLVVLPCKVGDTVYRVIRRKDGGGHIASATVSGLHMGDTERNRRYKKEKEYIVLKVDGNFCAHVDGGQICKTVFLTREEAEAALKKREDMK